MKKGLFKLIPFSKKSPPNNSKNTKTLNKKIKNSKNKPTVSIYANK